MMGSSGFVAKRINIKRCAVKKNRLVALSDEGAQAKRFVRIEDLDDGVDSLAQRCAFSCTPHTPTLRKQGTGTHYLASSGATLWSEALLAVY